MAADKVFWVVNDSQPLENRRLQTNEPNDQTLLPIGLIRIDLIFSLLFYFLFHQHHPHINTVKNSSIVLYTLFVE